MATTDASFTLPSPSSTFYTPNPTTPAFPDDLQWIKSYMVIHMLSVPSRRYGYLIWAAVAVVFLIVTILHWSGSRGGFIGAYWTKWSLRRRTVRYRLIGKKSHPFSLPSNAQLLCLTVLTTATLALSFIGPDYISPRSSNWSFHDARELYSRAAFDPSQLYPYQPQYTISKAFWTSGGRTGIIAFALLPLCILFALKAPPFALFAIPRLVQLHFDKLSWLHKWCGRFIWFITALHVALWSIQLSRDRRDATGKPALTYAWEYDKFIYGWTVSNPSFLSLCPS
jgi:hypothetical protein